MKNFVVIYHAPLSLMEQTADSTPEEMEKGMEQWMVWAKQCGEQLVDFGTPLMGGTKLNPDGSSIGSEKGVCGYSILQAEDMDGAKALLQGHPHLAWNPACEIEVHESMPPPGQS